MTKTDMRHKVAGVVPAVRQCKACRFFGTFEIITHTYAKIKNYFKRISAIKGHKFFLCPLIAAQPTRGLGDIYNQ